MYLAAILLLMLVLPLVSIGVEMAAAGGAPAALAFRWFVFWAVGVRLAFAGVKQVAQPAYTAGTIFGIEDPRLHVIVQELGFANLAFGLLGLLSLPFPAFRLAAAVAGGTFYLLAGLKHLMRGERNRMETVAMASDLAIAFLLFVLLAWRSGP
ncbi:DUF6790 family protein [Xanthobacter autotrophicus DSM 431]|uniref:DUF6790 family protein n=1 Tax=Xanthobacter nonsaccharivorans TaxID=3119912 RepID=UPI0037273A6C